MSWFYADQIEMFCGGPQLGTISFEGAFIFAIIMFPQDLYAKFVLNTAFSFFYHLRYFRFCIKNVLGLWFKEQPIFEFKNYFLNVNTWLFIIDLNPLCSPRSLKVDMPFPKVLNFLPTEILRLAIIKTLLSYCFILPNDFMKTLFVVLTLNIYFTLRRFNTYFIYSSQKNKDRMK